jgi:hypothetical protein
MIERKCPSCGAMVPFRSSISLLAVCPYCRALSQRKDLDLEKLGVSAQLQPDGTPLQVGSRGAFKGDAFEAIGRVQLKTPAGFWNEWFLAFADGRQGWLGEAQGTYAVSFALKTAAPARKDLTLGASVALGDRAYEVREVVEASYLAAEGELPFRPPLGETAPSADLISPGGWFATIDYSEEPPAVFAGQYQDFDALKLENLKAIEGWA